MKSIVGGRVSNKMADVTGCRRYSGGVVMAFMRCFCDSFCRILVHFSLLFLL